MIQLKQAQSGLIRECPTGFSWTTLFFGFFVPAVRGMYGYAAIWTLAALFTFGLSWLVLPFTINKAQLKFLLEKGYVPVADTDVKKIVAAGILYAPQTGQKAA